MIYCVEFFKNDQGRYGIEVTNNKLKLYPIFHSNDRVTVTGTMPVSLPNDSQPHSIHIITYRRCRDQSRLVLTYLLLV